MTHKEKLIFESLVTDSSIKPEDVSIIQVINSDNTILIWFKNLETNWNLHIRRHIISGCNVEKWVQNLIQESRDARINNLVVDI
jgi:hypothetical protein